MKKIVVVTGTDTGVGKTVATLAVVSQLIGKGLNCEVIKPVETGCSTDAEGNLVPEDGMQYASLLNKPVDEIVPIKFKNPVGPIVASDHEGREISLEKILHAITSAAERSDLLFVEGAGGLLVSLNRGYTFADLAKQLGASTLLVVGSRLGAANHTSLSLEVLRGRNVPIAGIIVNEMFGSGSQEEGEITALSTNKELLREVAESYEVAFLGTFPRLMGKMPEALLQGDSAAKEIAENLLRSLSI